VKLLLVNYEYPPIGAGAATASQAIAQNLAALGHEVTVLTSRYRELPAEETQDGVTICRVQSFRKHPDRSNLFEMLMFLTFALCRLPFVLAKHGPNAVIVFFSLPCGPLGLLAKLFFGTQYVISLRGGDVPGLVPHLDSIHKIIAPPRRLILKHARAIVANAEGLRALSEATDPYSVRVIPNGVDTKLFQPKAAGSTSSRSDEPLRILFVGRFQEQKNLEFLLRELARLPANSFELHMVGDGPQGKHLRDLAEQLGIAKSVTWRGWLPRSALPHVYQSMDCLVNPSLYEGMPNVVLEAMACSLPVIASNIPGNDILVVHGETGFLFDLQDPDGMLSALKRMYDVDLQRRMGANGRARALAEYSWRKVAESYLKIFEELD
jgi:glycosyltransferase involved in cell wall biosynthesis